MKLTEEEYAMSLKDFFKVGIDNFIEKHGFVSDYDAMKICGLNRNTIPNIRKTGGLNMRTFLKLGHGVGYNGNLINVIIRVLGDFK